jgi:hypothetical protein
MMIRKLTCIRWMGVVLTLFLISGCKFLQTTEIGS